LLHALQYAACFTLILYLHATIIDAQVLEPVIAAYAPDLVIVSAGFDAVVGDPLGGMCLSPELYGHLTARLIRLAPKLVLALEGGYNLRQTAECAVECTKVRVLYDLLDHPMP
jgi:histone deacetylase 6